MGKNLLYYGDTLEVLRQHVADATVDLIYLDPPFNSNRNYEVFWGETREGRSLRDQPEPYEHAWLRLRSWC